MQDGLGSVRGWVNSAASVSGIVNYTPYGVPDAAVDEFGFTGEQTNENGLVYLRARHYNPNVAIMTALDPYEGDAGRPMSLNGYAWVEGDPISNADPSGMQTNNPCPIGYPVNNATNADDPLCILPDGTSQVASMLEGRRIHQEPSCQSELCKVDVPAFVRYLLGCYEQETRRAYECRLECRTIVDYGFQRQCMADCLANSDAGRGGCKIEIAAYNFQNAIPGWVGAPDHAFIIYTPDGGNDNTARVFRGGPSGPPWDPGNILPTEQPTLGPDTLDYPRYVRLNGPRHLLMQGPDACDKLACLRLEIQRIASLNEPYEPLGPNSNTTAATMLRKCGIPDVSFPSVLGEALPGWWHTNLE